MSAPLQNLEQQAESPASAELSELRERVRELEQNLATAERGDARYRLLLEHINVGIFVSSLDGKMLECNERTLQLAGEATRESLFARDLSQSYEDPADRARLVAQLRSTGGVHNFEVWTRKADGRRTCALMTAVLAPLGPGGEPRILGMLEDITDKKLAERRAGEGEERFRVVAEQSMLGIAILQDGAIRFVNQAVADLNGYTIEEMSTWDVIDFGKLIHPDDVAFASDQARKKQAGDPGALPHYNYRIIDKAGRTRWVEQYSRSIEYCGKPANFVTIIDVTARKQAELALAELALGRERQAKLESLGVLAAGIAHDFNNLLSGLYGHIELARQGLPPDAEPRQYLDLAGQAFDRAKHLTGQLLTFSKGGAPVRKVGSLAQAVRQAAEFSLSGGKVKVELDLEPELWASEFDDNQLAQVFSNLLINAQQAMPGGGMLRIAGRNVLLAAGDLPRDALGLGRYVKLSFSDQGSGIAPGVAERIFDPFFTTKSQGSGLGLTTAYTIVKKHEGHIQLESPASGGATFHVWLPASTVAAVPVATPVPPLALGRGLVLLMDDDEMVCRVASSMLGRLGYESIIAKDGAAALSKARELGTQGRAPTAALLDLTVRSGEGGRDIVRALAELLPGMPIVASSGYCDDPVMARPEEFGFSASLKKPFLLSELGEVLAGVLVSS